MSEGESRDAVGPSRTGDDLMAADRRTLVIGAVAMAALVLVGVVSGSLFAGSACDDIAPRAVAPPEATGELDLLAVALDDLDDATVEELRAQLLALSGELGSLTGVAAAPGARSLVATTTGVASLGDEVVDWRAAGDQATAAVSLGSGTAVGSGAHLYSLALTNLLTGQVDALQPMDAALEGLTCQDTALVGSPLAFHLDAGAGQLLLLRVEEDGDEPGLELRDPVAGQVWTAELRLPTAPAGLAGARLTAGLGPDVVLAGTRTTPGEEAPVFTAVSRADGAALWSLDRSALADAGVPLSEERASRAEVVAIGETLALAVLREVDGDGGADEEAEQDLRSVGPQRLLALDPADGLVRWQVALTPTERVVAARAGGGDGEVVLVDADSSRTRILVATPEDVRTLDGPTAATAGQGGGSASTPLPVPTGPAGGVAELAGGATVLRVGSHVVVLPNGEGGSENAVPVVTAVAVPVVDVVRHRGGVSMLLAGPDEQRAVITFDGRPAAG